MRFRVVARRKSVYRSQRWKQSMWHWPKRQKKFCGCANSKYYHYSRRRSRICWLKISLRSLLQWNHRIKPVEAYRPEISFRARLNGETNDEPSIQDNTRLGSWYHVQGPRAEQVCGILRFYHEREECELTSVRREGACCWNRKGGRGEFLQKDPSNLHKGHTV